LLALYAASLPKSWCALHIEAYDYYLRGRNYSSRTTGEAIAQARQMYEKAIALDPQYSEVYAWLGGTYWIEWAWRWSVDPQTLERVFELAQKATALDASLPLSHSLLSYVYLQKKQGSLRFAVRDATYSGFMLWCVRSADTLRGQARGVGRDERG